MDDALETEALAGILSGQGPLRQTHTWSVPPDPESEQGSRAPRPLLWMRELPVQSKGSLRVRILGQLSDSVQTRPVEL
jgi:hypothetical protein